MNDCIVGLDLSSRSFQLAPEVGVVLPLSLRCTGVYRRDVRYLFHGHNDGEVVKRISLVYFQATRSNANYSGMKLYDITRGMDIYDSDTISIAPLLGMPAVSSTSPSASASSLDSR